MDVGALLLGFALLCVTAAFVAGPFMDERRAKRPVFERDLVEKQERKVVFTALRDLEFDYTTGKVVREDYEALKSGLMAEAARLIQDEQRDEKSKTAVEEDLEALIRTRKEATGASQQCAKCAAPLDSNDRFCPACGEPAASTCPTCGKTAPANDLFCSRCGTPLKSKLRMQ